MLAKAAAITIGATLATGFFQTFNTAEKAGFSIGKAYQKTNKQLGATQNLIKYRNLIGQLREKEKQAGGASKQLAAGIATVTRKYRQAKTEVKSYGIEVGKVIQAQKRLAMQSKHQKLTIGGRATAKKGWQDTKSNFMSTGIAAGMFAVPIKLAADFEQGMANVGAVVGATQKEMQQLTGQARHLGRTTMFSATEAAEGMQFLAMAGFKTKQIMASMPGMLNLAAAGNTELAETADIASNIMSGFNLKASEMNRIGDVLAKTFTNSNTDLQQLGEAMKYAAPTAAALGVSLEETASVMGFLGNAGIQGSMAGTAVSKMLSSLAAPASEGAKILADLNIQTQDMEGNLRPLGSVMADFEESLVDLGTAQKAAAVKAVFGERALKSMLNVLGKGNTAKIGKFTEMLKKAGGTAAEVAKKRLNTFWGKAKILGSALQDIGITLGNVFIPVLSVLASTISAILSPLGSLMEQFPLLTGAISYLIVGIVTINTVVPLLTGVYTMVKGYLMLTRANLLKTVVFMRSTLLPTVISTLTTAYTFIAGTAVPAIIGAVATMWGFIAPTLATVVGAVWTTALSVSAAIYSIPIIGWIAAAVAVVIGAAVLIYKYWEPISNFFSGLFNDNIAAIKTIWGWLKVLFEWSPVGIIMANWTPISEFFSGLWSGIVDSAKFAFEWILNKLNVIGSAWNTVKGWFGGGSDESPAESPMATNAVSSARASAPAAVAARNSNQKQVNNNQQITIQTQPGQSPDEIAEAVMRKQRELDDEQQQGALYDQNEYAFA
jgi:TP901 family phage tail tape measure protein